MASGTKAAQRLGRDGQRTTRGVVHRTEDGRFTLGYAGRSPIAQRPGPVTAIPRIPFGLARLPRSIGLDDPRLPTAAAGTDLLRLNTEPLPPSVMSEAGSDHAARVASMVDWLVSLCGDYVPLRRRFITSYFAFLAVELDAHRTSLAEGILRYDGLYTPDDWLWSAPRPLPRAWLPGPDGMLPAEIAFWDGAQLLAIELSARDTQGQAALQEAGVQVLRITPDALAEPGAVGALLPISFHKFWRGQTLPASPFRRPLPRGVIAPATT
jgi:hypothetical protein